MGHLLTCPPPKTIDPRVALSLLGTQDESNVATAENTMPLNSSMKIRTAISASNLSFKSKNTLHF